MTDRSRLKAHNSAADHDMCQQRLTCFRQRVTAFRDQMNAGEIACFGRAIRWTQRSGEGLACTVFNAPRHVMTRQQRRWKTTADIELQEGRAGLLEAALQPDCRGDRRKEITKWKCC